MKLEYIRQIPGMYGIVSAIYDVPVGEVWPESTNCRRYATALSAPGLPEVVESVPTHGDIKLGNAVTRSLDCELPAKTSATVRPSASR